MRLNELNEFKISLSLDELAKKHDVKLSLAHKSLYIFLLGFCIKTGRYDEDKGRYFTNLTVREMIDEYKAGHTTVINGLKLLSDCAAISRVKSSSLAVCGESNAKKSKSCVTYVNTDFLMNSEERG